MSAPRRRDVDATIDEIGGAEQDLDRMEPVPASGAKGDAAGAGDGCGSQSRSPSVKGATGEGWACGRRG